jgi:hypothetical protein
MMVVGNEMARAAALVGLLGYDAARIAELAAAAPSGFGRAAAMIPRGAARLSCKTRR